MRRLEIGLASGVCGILATGCMFGRLGESLERIDELSSIRVDITETSGSGKPILVFMGYAETQERTKVSVVYDVGEVELFCESGAYLVGAIEDLNEDFRYQEDEPMAFWGDLEPIPVTKGESRRIELRLGRSAVKLDERTAAFLETRRTENPELEATTVVRSSSLDDPIFAPENSELGGWEPAEFIDRRYPGVYLLEEYDPSRTPVLFVHGIFGSPRDFAPTIEGLDRTRYQAWVYYYPSSLRLELIGSHLFEQMGLLMSELQPEEMILICHSMGGLVGRHAVNLYTDAKRDYLRAFVTIASPLAGISSAAAGARWAPVPMPCWLDLSPGSPFLTSLFQEPLPEGLPYHMVFAFAEGDGDGTVPTKSQLRDEALEQASKLTAVDAGHVDVLAHPRTLGLVNSL